ncbi:hypothetical protein [Streptomyces sp. NPDC003077]|uniref:hypothetical protein n=1 Tax=Streptomyces sp. NPDC003077 TaxID=3154443 RepID=UPI0033A43B35
MPDALNSPTDDADAADAAQAPDVQDPTLIMGVHGVLVLHPWIARASAEFDLDPDVFGLAVQRAEAYGWSSTHLGPAGELDGRRWSHHDAGGDWTQDGRVREVAWLQVGAARGLRGQRLPVLPVATVLGDVLRRVGRFRLTGLHTVAPPHLAPDAAAVLAGAADWFALADPDGAAGLTVTVSGREADGADRAPLVRKHTQESAYGRLALTGILPADVLSSGPLPTGLARPLTGAVQTEGMRPLMAFGCRAREWSPDVAAWTTEVVLDALRATGTTESVLVTVSVEDGGVPGGTGAAET